MAAFGLPVNAAAIHIFGKTKALVIERFDRTWTKDGRLLRIPQEDCCQALSTPPTRKYQNEGGPGMVDILTLLKGSDIPADDQKNFLKAQILYWLIGATDGHAKNFSLFLGPGGRFNLTPLYDVLTAQPSLDARHILKKQMKLAMSVGNSRHYTIDSIQGRHFVQTVQRAGLACHCAERVRGNCEGRRNRPKGGRKPIADRIFRRNPLLCASRINITTGHHLKNFGTLRQVASENFTKLNGMFTIHHFLGL